MLTITKEQFQVMRETHKSEQSIPALCKHLRQSYNHTHIAQMSDEELTKKVKQTVDIAYSYHLESKNDIYGFVELELTQCPGFYQYPPIEVLLKDPKAHPDMRMLWVAQKLPAHIWAKVS